jgi:hypothetical protein
MSDGKTVQIREGPQEGAVVALNFPSELNDGAPVQPVQPEGSH